MIDEAAWMDAWRAREPDKLVALCDPEVEVEAVSLSIEPRQYRGHDGIRQWMRDVRERFNTRTEPGSIERLGDDALMVVGTLHIQPDVSHEVEEQPFALVIHLRDDKALWVGTFMSVAEAKTAYENGITGPSGG